ncbi:acyl carrier protein [Mucilaginibacter gotjawali]|uniref:Acyl carrier protein n=1 Tax=Mucilaginibacter gotjawali TaxID=1550579 RepID=A0A839SCD9_9SPHI|nr:acyl carrier protein [Mucilaginibacter gotjawali]MBB3054359.1 acyl carrier protein [Mucilaginibacter gotjawali]
MELQDFVKKFADQFDNTDPEEITASTRYQELEEWSSLTILVVITFVTTEYGKPVTGAELRSCETVEDLYNLIASK